MPTLLQIDFPDSGPRGAEMAQAYAELAEVIAQTPGLRWKIWTENEDRAGGIYLFDDLASAQAYLEVHSARLASFGYTDLRPLFFDVNEQLSAVTRGPLSA